MSLKPESILIFPRNKFILASGVLLALMSAISLYLFYNILIDAINFMFSLMDFEQWTQAMSIKPYYNLFIAAISIVFGISVCFSFWAKANRYYTSRGRLKNLHYLNEQRNVTWSFLFFFTQLGFVLVIFYAGNFRASDYLYRAFQSYFWLFVFIPIGLFFQLWKPIISVLRKKAYPILALVFVISAVGTYGLSKWDAVDFCSFDFNEGMILNDKLYEYQVRLPHQLEAKRIVKQSWCNHITVALDSNNEEILFYNRQRIEFKDLKQKILESRMEHPPSIRYYLSYVIDADSSLSDSRLEHISKYLYYTLRISSNRLFRGVHKKFSIGSPRKYSTHVRKLDFVPHPYLKDIKEKLLAGGVENFEMTLPLTSTEFNRFNKSITSFELYFISTEGGAEFLFFHDEIIEFEELELKILEAKSPYQFEIQPYIRIAIMADSSVSDKELKPIADRIIRTGTLPNAIVRGCISTSPIGFSPTGTVGFKKLDYSKY